MEMEGRERQSEDLFRTTEDSNKKKLKQEITETCDLATLRKAKRRRYRIPPALFLLLYWLVVVSSQATRNLRKISWVVAGIAI
jgi:hypothetical protein